ncbi:carbohydrate esterase family 1 protein [Zopfia rhizophila CBS 207.26]|uniref:Feruloyl esterase C n=1 Tax=Zopfia rhizophila CBS 207.26 TaxID=1314779 RepID=A0A6A6E054_9PEZI|nr:carbohydrate esterase family 1 protein [Zopfia rhizophila CBS 207.26]
MKSIAVLAIFLSALNGVSALASPGCGKAPTMTTGNHTITANGTNRSYYVRLPANYDQNQQYRLIFEFHWAHGSASQIINGGYAPSYYGLPSLDTNNSVIYVVPEGLFEGPDQRSSTSFQGWANKNGQDVTFTDTMISTIENGLCVDQNLIFSMGHSYGAGMSYALACARPNVFRAVAINSGALISGCSGGTSPVAMYIQHGTQDSTLPISAGRSIRDQFVKNNDCTPQASEPVPPSGGHKNVVYSGCSAGHPITWTVYDGGHVPAPKDSGAATSFTPANNWQFFSQFS